ncbi:MAG: Gfo/Idh/MocA family oxidoreductase, partial [Natronospirillum sp.]
MTGTQPFRWGIIAPGRIAHNFASALSVVPDAELAAVASRNAARGQAFADQYSTGGVSPRVYADYAELVQDPSIDAIYIANPHRFHADSVALCLAADKPVLCEKPLMVNAEQAQALFAVAEARGVFLMEALWSRFLPAWDQVMQWLQADAIGTVHTIQSEFCF